MRVLRNTRPLPSSSVLAAITMRLPGTGVCPAIRCAAAQRLSVHRTIFAVWVSSILLLIQPRSSERDFDRSSIGRIWVVYRERYDVTGERILRNGELSQRVRRQVLIQLDHHFVDPN